MFFRKRVNELEIFKCAQGDIVPIENVPDSVYLRSLYTGITTEISIIYKLYSKLKF